VSREFFENKGMMPVDDVMLVDVDMGGEIIHGLKACNVCWDLAMPEPLVVRRWRVADAAGDVFASEFEVSERVSAESEGWE